jgi:hypothetical protein
MNNLQFSEAIKSECKKQHIKIGDLLENCGLNKGFISDLSRKNKTQSIADWCRELKLDYVKINARISHLHWSAEKAFETK